MGVAFGSWAGTPPVEQILVSPGGRHVAFVAARKKDLWKTIWLAGTDGAKVQDLLPESLSEAFGSPGVRAVALGQWLTDRALVFEQRCGTGCLSLHTVDVVSGAYSNLCVAQVDRGIHWGPSGRAIVEGHLGEISMVDADRAMPGSRKPPSDCRRVLEGCRVIEGKATGRWYSFNDWSPDGKHVLLTRHTCEALDVAALDPGDLVLWRVGEMSCTDLASSASLATFRRKNDGVSPCGFNVMAYRLRPARRFVAGKTASAPTRRV